MEESFENINYQDLMTYQLNKGARITLVYDDKNAWCFSDGTFIEIQKLKHDSFRLRKIVEG